MIVKFIIPVIDTESGDYSFNGRDFSMDEYFDMLNDHVDRTNSMMNKFARNYARKYDKESGIRHDEYDIKEGVVISRGAILPSMDINAEDNFDFSESQAFIQDIDSNDLQIDGLDGFVKSGKKFLMKININPTSMDGDAESEMRNWIDESNSILLDEDLDNKTMLMALPLRDFIIDTNGDDDKKGDKPIYQLLGCKILKILDKYPYYFTLMVEKIVEDK